MEWEGHNSVPPEMWLLPNWFPFHPGRLWCHCRMVYLPMCYLYGSRYVYPQAETDPLIAALRKEIYTTPYQDIVWDATRHWVPTPFFLACMRGVCVCVCVCACPMPQVVSHGHRLACT